MAEPASLYLGLISGTSADGIDAALVRFEPEVRVVAAATMAYSGGLRARILALAHSTASVELDELGRLDVAIGDAFASAANALIASAGIASADVVAIGSHGQTVRHRPLGAHPFTLQIGDPSVIAERTGITTIGDFRRADVAAGGQGAPLAPALHAAVFGGADGERVVLNLGGIANVTVLRGRDVLGFDTGPANCLLDAWAARHLGVACDRDGAWGLGGRLDEALLGVLLDDPWFDLPPPKSTGREQFNLDWLDARLGKPKHAPADVQATLVALSARTVADAVRTHAPNAREVIACGGGVHNAVLMRALANTLDCPLRTTADYGLDPDFVEAAAFAWLARERLAHRPGNLPSVTGARGPRVLGGIYAAP